MRSLLPFIPLVAALTATAQDLTVLTQLATPSERAWIYLTIITSFTPEEYADTLRVMGVQSVSEEGMQALRNHVNEGTEELDALGDRNVEALCTRRAEFEADPEKLAREFERQSADEDAIRQRLVDRVDQVLNPGDAATLWWMMEHDVFVKTSGGLPGVGVDLPAEIRSGSMTPTEIVDRACEALGRS